MTTVGELTSRRKDEHLTLVREQNVDSEIDAGWDAIDLPHRALPELDFAQIDSSVEFLGRRFPTPFLISSMTGGSPEGERINERLARFAERRQIPMGVGSQRVALENRSSGFFSLRKVAPRATLYANLGLVQFNYGVTIDDCRWLVDHLEAQALILHCNPLQEAIQKEGDRDFSNLLSRIGDLKRALPVPVILKETGSGLDVLTCDRAIEAGIDALDLAGLGGTHWGFIEGLREQSRRELGTMFRNWGIPTARALADAHRVVKGRVPLIASGGVRHGLDAARAVSLGANLVGMAAPFLRQLTSVNEDSLDEFLDLQHEAFRIALFCTGSRDVESLRRSSHG